jgi:indolepyruvate ferredoxin oxidoreductase beta subunit
MLSKTTNIILSGVGGQGILLASAVISQAAVISGNDVKTNEVHGMAQRGGSVIAQVRFGEKVFSPLIKKGDADFLVALEKVEAVRYADYLKSDGVAIVNMQKIIPVTVASGLATYPGNIDDVLKERLPNLKTLDCISIAEKIGNVRVANVVLIGVLSRYLPFNLETWESAISDNVPQKALEANMKAFGTGRDTF